MYERAKSLAALCFYLVIGAMLFHRALSIGFLADFAGDILVSQNDWFNFAAYQWNFYVPAMMLYYWFYKVFGLNPVPYHVFQLVLIIINAWLIYKIARALEFETWQCWIAGLLTLFNSVASEAYFWLSQTPKVVATTISLIALMFIIRLRQTGSQIWGWSYLIAVTMALTVESTALILPVLGLILDTYCTQRWPGSKKGFPLFAGFRIHFLTFSIAGMFLMFRHFLGIRPYVINLPLIGKMRTFARTLVGTFYHGFDDHLGAFQIADFLLFVLILGLLVLLLLAWKMKSRSERRLFLALLLLWIGACLPHTVGANVCSRYFYFPGVFASLLIVNLLGTFSARLHNPRSAFLLIAMVIAILLSLDLRAFRLSLDSYLDASRIYNAGLRKITSSLPRVSPDMHLVLIDFPDFLCSRQGGPKGYAIYIYRNAIPAHLILLYKTNKINSTVLWISPLGSPIDSQELAELMAAPNVVAFRYVPKNNDFIMMKGNGKQ